MYLYNKLINLLFSKPKFYKILLGPAKGIYLFMALRTGLKKFLGTYEKVTIQPEQATAERVDQALYFVAKKDKPGLLAHLIHEKEPDSTLVFSYFYF